MSFYLDDELRGAERTRFETHLTGCATCRASYESERDFLQSLREAAPLHTASTELRTRVEDAILQSSIIPRAPDALKKRVQRFIHEPYSERRSVGFSFATIVAATLLVIAIGSVLFFKKKPRLPVSTASEFALMAADTHQRHLKKKLPLEVVSDAPAVISSWFAGKLPFAVKLPNYQESSGQEKLYQLEGARLVGYKNDYAAYVAYQMRTRPISLVITSDAVAQPAGGEEILAKGIRFHYDSIQGYKVLTWSDRGLTYALVSDLDERGQQSCVVCHQGTKDRDVIEALKPK
jgi:anti-sigma factor RsiW